MGGVLEMVQEGNFRLFSQRVAIFGLQLMSSQGALANRAPPSVTGLLAHALSVAEQKKSVTDLVPGGLLTLFRMASGELQLGSESDPQDTGTDSATQSTITRLDAARALASTIGTLSSLGADVNKEWIDRIRTSGVACLLNLDEKQAEQLSEEQGIAVKQSSRHGRVPSLHVKLNQMRSKTPSPGPGMEHRISAGVIGRNRSRSSGRDALLRGKKKKTKKGFMGISKALKAFHQHEEKEKRAVSKLENKLRMAVEVR